MEIQYISFVLWPHKTTWLKGHITIWGLLVACHHPDKFGDRKYCDSGDMFLICHATSRGYVFKDLTKRRDWMIMSLWEWEFLIICHHPAKFGGHRRCDSGDIVCFVTWSRKTTWLKIRTTLWVGVGHHPTKFGGYRQSNIGDIFVLGCHVI